MEVEKEIVILYEGQEVGRHRLDIVAGNRVIIELKAVEEIGKAHYAQVRSYLRTTGLPLAILVNFASNYSPRRHGEHGVPRRLNPLEALSIPL